MSGEFWITTAAIVIGPLSAVIISQWLQSRDKLKDRQLYVLRALMSTRRAPLNYDRIMALNLIDIEFSKNSNIRKIFKDLMTIYNDVDRWKNEDQDVRSRLLDDVDDASVRLIEAISKHLGYKYDNIEILRGGYYPSGLSDQEEQNRIIREFFVGMRNGSLYLPVALLDARHPKKVLDQARETMAVMEAAQHDEDK